MCSSKFFRKGLLQKIVFGEKLIFLVTEELKGNTDFIENAIGNLLAYLMIEPNLPQLDLHIEWIA